MVVLRSDSEEHLFANTATMPTDAIELVSQYIRHLVSLQTSLKPQVSLGGRIASAVTEAMELNGGRGEVLRFAQGFQLDTSAVKHEAWMDELGSGPSLEVPYRLTLGTVNAQHPAVLRNFVAPDVLAYGVEFVMRGLDNPRHSELVKQQVAWGQGLTIARRGVNPTATVTLKVWGPGGQRVMAMTPLDETHIGEAETAPMYTTVNATTGLVQVQFYPGQCDDEVTAVPPTVAD